MEEEKQKVPSARVRQPAAHPGAAVAATAERVGGTPVCPPVRHRRVAPDLGPGPRQRAQATADPCLRFQSGDADASPDGGRHAAKSPGPRLDASFYGFLDPQGPLDRLESPAGALLGVDPARFAVLGSSDPLLNHLTVTVRQEHKRAKSGFFHGLIQRRVCFHLHDYERPGEHTSDSLRPLCLSCYVLLQRVQGHHSDTQRRPISWEPGHPSIGNYQGWCVPFFAIVAKSTLCNRIAASDQFLVDTHAAREE